MGPFRRKYAFPVAALPELLSTDGHSPDNTIPGVLDEPEVNVFECSRCRVDFLTEDHLTIAGTAVP